MKRCPQCSFLYLDSDQLCDLDQTLLIADDFGTDDAVLESTEGQGKNLSLAGVREPKVRKLPLAVTGPKPKSEKVLTTPVARKRKRKVSPKTLVAAVVAGLIIGLGALFTYQRTHPTVQARQAPPTSQTQASQTSRIFLDAQQAADEAANNARIAQQEAGLPDAPEENTQSTSLPAKTAPNPRPESTRVRVSSNPVSTGDVAKSAKGPVTISLDDGSTLQADEVWRTKAGIWYRRKGIVTFIKPNRVRAMNN